ncbi:MAG TPA: HAMP domain-containing sensor histidine kinase [Chloroflexota bacterium]|nr:HAMP domain-containing sensor histidine kinase [Chloroflexota bacterium]
MGLEHARAEAPRAEPGQRRLLATLEGLLAIDVTDLRAALSDAAQRVAEALTADKVDAMFYDSAIDSLVALGSSATPMGRKQRAIGMDRLPLANGGSAVRVFRTGVPHLTGRADLEPGELAGVVEGLGIRSEITVPLDVASERRGVLLASSARPDFFAEDDLSFLGAVARWVGLLAQRAELIEHIAEAAAERGRRGAAEELITVLAHDLRNQLTPVRGRLGLLQRRARREGREEYLQDAEEVARSLVRLERLIEDLLDAARLEQGLFALNRQPVGLVALARETVDTVRTEAIPIDVCTAEAEVRVVADPDRVRQVLENLLANAVKHSPAGAAVRVRVGTEERPGGTWATVTVSDQGPGIPAELVPRLFERFALGPGSTGLGLGLYLARRLAEAHGGTLTVDSTLGAGTHFTLALPAGRVPPDPGGRPRPRTAR